MNEQDILAAIAQANHAFDEAKEKMARAKRVWVEAETGVIETKLALARLREQLRVYRKTTPDYTPDARESEIESFRERNPDVVEFARQRDKIEEEE